jgi:hypothetical protein
MEGGGHSVTGLYTVIDHDKGIQACEEAIENRNQEQKKRMPTKYISRLLRLILKSNCFTFMKRFFHQQTGTAMGTPMAPAYANHFMGMVEKKMLDQYEHLTGLRPVNWVRYLDNIFFM